MVIQTKRDKDKGKEEEFQLPESQKYKLTLTIDKEVVRRAKIDNVNISYLTETFLHLVTYRESEIEEFQDEIVDAWYMFFVEIIKILNKFKVKVWIGDWSIEDKKRKETRYVALYLAPGGRLYKYDLQRRIKVTDANIDIFPKYTQNDDIYTALTKDTIRSYLISEVLFKPIAIVFNTLRVIETEGQQGLKQLEDIKVAVKILKVLVEEADSLAGEIDRYKQSE